MSNGVCMFTMIPDAKLAEVRAALPSLAVGGHAITLRQDGDAGTYETANFSRLDATALQQHLQQQQDRIRAEKLCPQCNHALHLCSSRNSSDGFCGVQSWTFVCAGCALCVYHYCESYGDIFGDAAFNAKPVLPPL
eukprot:gnl/Spiro4/15286_TR8206_c0_g1_i1.p2 gnl/Spiro4/15286_TR8206_c0_g1~~gnl/Spiro4/15286_TR8206_c0_g1_i1.p2  ORF type:complete len:149 (+),score=39.64 gnl/Spiro4/15286_TR8206_c0_g1_i1:40-447(+)